MRTPPADNGAGGFLVLALAPLNSSPVPTCSVRLWPHAITRAWRSNMMSR
jgi:hypothetical protein